MQATIQDRLGDAIRASWASIEALADEAARDPAKALALLEVLGVSSFGPHASERAVLVLSRMLDAERERASRAARHLVDRVAAVTAAPGAVTAALFGDGGIVPISVPRPTVSVPMVAPRALARHWADGVALYAGRLDRLPPGHPLHTADCDRLVMGSGCWLLPLGGGLAWVGVAESGVPSWFAAAEVRELGDALAAIRVEQRRVAEHEARLEAMQRAEDAREQARRLRTDPAVMADRLQQVEAELARLRGVPLTTP